jgi:hypothetical protein
VGEQFQFGIWPASAMTPHREVPKSHSSSAFGNLRRREAMDENRPSPSFYASQFLDTTERERDTDWPAFAQSHGTQFVRTTR